MVLHIAVKLRVKAFSTIKPKDIGNLDQLKASWGKVTKTLSKDSYFSIKSSGLDRPDILKLFGIFKSAFIEYLVRLRVMHY